MRSFAEITQDRKEEIAKEASKHPRFKVIDEFYNILNHERAQKNESVVEKFRQEYDIGRAEAVKKAKGMKYMWMPELSKRMIALKLGKFKDASDVRALLDEVKAKGVGSQERWFNYKVKGWNIRSTFK